MECTNLCWSLVVVLGFSVLFTCFIVITSLLCSSFKFLLLYDFSSNWGLLLFNLFWSLWFSYWCCIRITTRGKEIWNLFLFIYFFSFRHRWGSSSLRSLLFHKSLRSFTLLWHWSFSFLESIIVRTFRWTWKLSLHSHRWELSLWSQDLLYLSIF